MRETPDALKILLEEGEKWSFIPAKLIEQIYRIEHRVQFDEERHDAPSRIRQVIKATLDEERLKGSSDGDAI